MEGAAEFQDWELLAGRDSVVPVAASVFAPASATEDSPPRARADSDGVIRSDYFGLNGENWCVYLRGSSSSDGHHEGGGVPESDDPSWVDHNFGSGVPDAPSREVSGLAAAEFQDSASGGLWTPDQSSGGQVMPPLHDHAKGELDSSAGSQLELVLEGVGSNGGEGEGKRSYLEETGVVEDGGDVSGELGSAIGSPNITVAPESAVERSTGDGDSENLSVAKVEKAGMAWWKLPVEIMKFYVFRIRPVWSISFAAALVGVLMLGRKLYKKKPKTRSIPLKVCVEDKKVSQFMVRAARLNEAFLVVKQVPVVRSTLPTAGLTPWPVVALR